MNSFPTNAALEAAIVANADEDTPRLAYADWLDEHGDPDRAEFIRIQCRLAELPHSDPAWVDLTERQEELAARFSYRRESLFPPNPERFYFGHDFVNKVGEPDDPFQRGFPYFTSCQMSGHEWDDAAIERVKIALTRLVETTTVRGIWFYEISSAALTELLSVPAFAQLSSLSFMLQPSTPSRMTAAYQRLANSPAMRHIRSLVINSEPDAAGVAAIAAASTFESLRRLCKAGYLPIAHLLRYSWFNRIRWLRVLLNVTQVPSLFANLAELRDLQVLELSGFQSAIDPVRLSSLGRFQFSGELNPTTAQSLVKLECPRLAVFEAERQSINNDTFKTLMQAEWFNGLRSLNLKSNAIGDRAVAALRRSPAAGQLRDLRIGDNPIGKSGLLALARDGGFPNLIALDLERFSKGKVDEDDMATVLAALAIPGMRCLNLNGLPVGDGGAAALASNPAVGNLKRLFLSHCRIGDTGASALMASPYLQNLVELRLDRNEIRTGADALVDPSVMPDLGEVWLNANRIPRDISERIQQREMRAIT